MVLDLSKVNISILKYILPLFFGWKAALLFITYFGLSTFPSYNGITNDLFLPSSDIDYWFRWTNWDGGHFRGIAESGYLPQQTVFFPLFPLLMKALTIAGLNVNFSGLLISHISFLIALFFLYKLILLDFKEIVAKRAVIALLIFPTSFYFGTLYSESLFLALTVTSFYFVRVGNLKSSVFLAAGSIATRLTGIATPLAFLGEHLLKKDENFNISLIWKTTLRKLLLSIVALSSVIKFITNNGLVFKSYLALGFLNQIFEFINLIIILLFTGVIFEFLIKNLNFRNVFSKTTLIYLLIFLPIPLYMFYQQILFQKPLGFLTNEFLWNRHFSLPHKPFMDYLDYLISSGIFQIGNPARSLTELVFFAGGLVGLIFSFYKLRLSYSIFYFLSLILPTLSSTLIAMPRYILIIFPLFILMGMVENKALQKIYILFSIMLLAAYSMLFMGWYWVT